jgi:type IV pilus assembly protein PilB
MKTISRLSKKSENVLRSSTTIDSVPLPQLHVASPSYSAPIHSGGARWVDKSALKSSHVNNLSLQELSTQEARDCLPASVARQYEVLPLRFLTDKDSGQQVLELATARVNDLKLKHELRFVLGHEPLFLEYPTHDVHKNIELCYGEGEKKLQAVVAAIQDYESNALVKYQKRRLQGVKIVEAQVPQNSTDSIISEFVQSLLYLGCQRGASDIHIIPMERGTIVRFRVEGQLLSHDNPVSTLDLHTRIVRRLKILAGLDTNKSGALIDGEFIFNAGLYSYAVRIAAMPTIWGDRVTLRLHATHASALDVNELGFSLHVQQVLENFCVGISGLGIFAGPTGAGKTTLVYSLIKKFVAQGYQVMTVEDPVEIPIAGVSQTAVHAARGVTFAGAIRSILRHDPDVIMVGEIRDEETAKIALRAALSGHFVLTTIHARHIQGVFHRFREFGIEQSMLHDALRLIMCQDLLPLLCSRCKIQNQQKVWIAVGCERCSFSGRSGRMPIIESLSGRFETVDQGCSWNELRSNKNLTHISRNETVEKALQEGLVSSEDAHKIC